MTADNIATNTRVRIREIGNHHIIATTIGETKERIIVLPRIRFNFKLPFGQSYTITRTQFPLRLAYSMTYNKSQGQTISKILLDITTFPFAHGHLYVALSRVRSIKHIKFYLDHERNIIPLDVHSDYNWKNVPKVNNVFHKSILDKIVFF
jgi:hypothetical protein